MRWLGAVNTTGLLRVKSAARQSAASAPLPTSTALMSASVPETMQSVSACPLDPAMTRSVGRQTSEFVPDIALWTSDDKIPDDVPRLPNPFAPDKLELGRRPCRRAPDLLRLT